jgi:hypothetical protein
VNAHCKDCCCARIWDALGVTQYNGIVDNVAALKAERDGFAKEIDAANEASLHYMRERDALARQVEAVKAIREAWASAGYTFFVTQIDAALTPAANSPPWGEERRVKQQEPCWLYFRHDNTTRPYYDRAATGLTADTRKTKETP